MTSLKRVLFAFFINSALTLVVTTASNITSPTVEFKPDFKFLIEGVFYDKYYTYEPIYNCREHYREIAKKSMSEAEYLTNSIELLKEESEDNFEIEKSFVFDFYKRVVSHIFKDCKEISRFATSLAVIPLKMEYSFINKMLCKLIEQNDLSKSILLKVRDEVKKLYIKKLLDLDVYTNEALKEIKKGDFFTTNNCSKLEKSRITNIKVGIMQILKGKTNFKKISGYIYLDNFWLFEPNTSFGEGDLLPSFPMISIIHNMVETISYLLKYLDDHIHILENIESNNFEDHTYIRVNPNGEHSKIYYNYNCLLENRITLHEDNTFLLINPTEDFPAIYEVDDSLNMLKTFIKMNPDEKNSKIYYVRTDSSLLKRSIFLNLNLNFAESPPMISVAKNSLLEKQFDYKEKFESIIRVRALRNLYANERRGRNKAKKVFGLPNTFFDNIPKIPENHEIESFVDRVVYNLFEQKTPTPIKNNKISHHSFNKKNIQNKKAKKVKRSRKKHNPSSLFNNRGFKKNKKALRFKKSNYNIKKSVKQTKKHSNQKKLQVINCKTKKPSNTKPRIKNNKPISSSRLNYRGEGDRSEGSKYLRPQDSSINACSNQKKALSKSFNKKASECKETEFLVKEISGRNTNKLREIRAINTNNGQRSSNDSKNKKGISKSIKYSREKPNITSVVNNKKNISNNNNVTQQPINKSLIKKNYIKKSIISRTPVDNLLRSLNMIVEGEQEHKQYYSVKKVETKNLDIENFNNRELPDQSHSIVKLKDNGGKGEKFYISVTANGSSKMRHLNDFLRKVYGEKIKKKKYGCLIVRHSDKSIEMGYRLLNINRDAQEESPYVFFKAHQLHNGGSVFSKEVLKCFFKRNFEKAGYRNPKTGKFYSFLKVIELSTVAKTNIDIRKIK